MLILLLLALPAAAQVSESIEVHVLEIEATVLDRGGKPVEGLTAADFEVKVDGKRAEISNFYLVKRGVILESGAAGASPAGPTDAQYIPTRLLLFIDDAHLHQRSKRRVLDSLKTFVEKTMDDATTAMLVRWNGSSINVVVPGTKDRARLLAALEQMAREPALMRHVESHRGLLDELKKSDLDSQVLYQHILAYCENQTNETRRSIDALLAVTRTASGLEGRKILLHVSEGLPLFAGWEMLASVGMENSLDVMKFDLSEQYRRLAKFAQESGVVFCPFDPSGGDGATYAVDVPGGNPRPDLIRENNRNTMVLLARETGGQLVADTNELDLALTRVTDQVTTYYSIGVPAPRNERGPFDVHVSLRNRRDLRVVTAPRRGVQSRAETIANGVRSRLYLREETNPLDARLTAATPRRDGTRCVVSLTVTAPASKLTLIPEGEISFHFALLDDKQQESPVKSSKKKLHSGEEVTETVLLGVKPRKYLVSSALVDEVSGEVAYLQQEIDATVCSK